MYKHQRTIFNELLDFLPQKRFESLIGQHGFNRYKKRFSGYNLLLILMYAQITGKDSLRDIETGLSVHNNLHYHLGIQSIKRTTIAYNNKTCPSEIFEKTFYELLKQVQGFYANKRFKFIKQNLKIKSFLGTSENAVKNQLRVAMIYYLLVCYIKFKTNVKQGLLELSRLFSEALLLRIKIIDLLGISTHQLKNISHLSRYGPTQNTLF